jgi:hypothetical protein
VTHDGCVRSNGSLLAVGDFRDDCKLVSTVVLARRSPSSLKLARLFVKIGIICRQSCLELSINTHPVAMVAEMVGLCCEVSTKNSNYGGRMPFKRTERLERTTNRASLGNKIEAELDLLGNWVNNYSNTHTFIYSLLCERRKDI